MRARACCGRSPPAPWRWRSARRIANRPATRPVSRLRPTALGLEPEALQLVAETGFYRVYSENGSGRVAAIDGLGAVALAEDARRIMAATGDELVEELRREVEAATRNLGVATLLPRVSLVCGSQILDLSDARRPEDVAVAAARTLEGHTGTAVAVVTR